MKLKIAGSGGMFLIPNPFCKCPVCQEARIKRGRYERLGPSLYIEDIGMLIDTPEDIAVACDRQGISRIDYLSISHKDPDHTRGMRIVEPLGYDCIAGKGTPIQFIALPEVVDDINAWNGDGLYYYQNILNCISINRTNYAKIGSIELHLINNKTHRGNMTFYVISDGSKKAVYACCDVKPFVPNELYYDADVLIIGLVSDDGILKDGSALDSAPFRDDMFTLDEMLELKRTYRIKRIVITHIDEYWGKSYAYYREFEKSWTMYHLPMTAWRLSYSRRRPEPFICVMGSPLDHLFLIWTNPQTRNRKPIKTDAIIPAGLSENSDPLFTNSDCITEKTLLEICIIIVILMSPVRVRSEPRISPIHIALANCTGLRWETANRQESWHCL